MPSTVLIGEGALAQQCLGLMVARGLRPALVCSFDGSLVDASEQHGVDHVDRREAVRRWHAEHGSDVLLSIRNPWVLPAALLDGVRRIAINFHDSLLPRYAGLHATSWAIIEGEREHGISWHEITPDIDTGRLLAQVPVPIEPDDTALTLNAKCFDAALGAFDDVLGALLADAVQLTPQHGTRSYFGGDQRPTAQCVLDFDRPADTLVNLVRALDFGHAPNPLGRAKLWRGDQPPLLVGEAVATSTASTQPAGTLLSCEGGQLLVATRTHDLRLRRLTRLDDAPLSDRHLAEHLGPHRGAPLPSPSLDERDALSALDRRVCRGERAWRRLLAAGTRPATHPLVPAAAWGPPRPVSLPELTRALDPVPPAARAATARALLAAYAARLNPTGPCDLGVVAPEACGPAHLLFAPVVPWRVPTPAALTFEAFDAEVERTWARLQRRPTFARDLGPRSPALRDRPLLPARWPIAVLSGDAPPPFLPAEIALLFAVDPAHGHVRPWAAEAISSDSLARLDAQLAALARSALADPGHPVATLPLLDPAERQRVLITWNDTARPVPSACIHQLVQQQARRTPRAPAVRFGDTGSTYAQLDARANQLAHALRELGVGVGDRVALAVDRSVDLVAAMLGILAAGATYVPVDHRLPGERVAMLLRRSAPALVVTDAATHAALADHALERFGLHQRAAMLDAQPIAAPDVPADPERVAYVVFTSGSTGEPKAVEVLHRGLVNHALAVQAHYRFGPGDRMLCSAPIGFDIIGEQIYPPLAHGAEVIVRPNDLLDSFRGFDAFVRDRAITIVALPTAFWHEWVHHLDARDLPVPPALRVLGVGTEKVLGDALAAWRRREAQPVRFIQGYGPTETTITSTMFVHDGAHVDPSRPLPIGRPLANTEIYLLDPAGQPVPVGMPGEIWIGGHGLARGYLGQPRLTAERFVPHPFSDRSGARLYKTGDLARYEPDGQLVFLGRTDAQVKIRGHRVELGEIEAVIGEHPSVHECVVLLRDDPDQPRQLVAYLRVEPGHDPDALRARCRARLPGYMVPSVFAVLPAFPVTPNGKIDRARLPAPAAPAPRRVRDARDDVELILAGAFAEVLGRPEVGMSEGFFELGGDSLGAMALLARLETTFEASIPLEQFLRTSTVESLGAFICRSPRRGTVDRPSVVRLKGGEGPPVVLVMGMFLYQYLARALEAPNPVYSVYLPIEAELLRRGQPLPPVEQLARDYVEVLRAHTPHGPYILGGSSFGGVVAFEMARQLVAEREPVPLVMLLDTVLPAGRARGLRPWAEVAARALLTEQRAEVVGRLRERLEQLRARVARARGAAPPDPRLAERARLQAWRDDEYERAQLAYDRVVHPYDGPVVLYRARAPRRPVLPFHGFERHARGRLDACDVPGDHMSMLTTGHIEAVAADLLARLAASPPLRDLPS